MNSPLPYEPCVCFVKLLTTASTASFSTCLARTSGSGALPLLLASVDVWFDAVWDIVAFFAAEFILCCKLVTMTSDRGTVLLALLFLFVVVLLLLFMFAVDLLLLALVINVVILVLLIFVGLLVMMMLLPFLIDSFWPPAEMVADVTKSLCCCSWLMTVVTPFVCCILLPFFPLHLLSASYIK